MERKTSNQWRECMKNKPRIYGKECWEKTKADKKKHLEIIGRKEKAR